jgi:hypothetical protein
MAAPILPIRRCLVTLRRHSRWSLKKTESTAGIERNRESPVSADDG